jgi:hypothetical protein
MTELLKGENAAKVSVDCVEANVKRGAPKKKRLEVWVSMRFTG